MERSEVKTIIEAAIPTKIPYMDHPPAKGGEIKYLTLDEFKEKFNCEYTEGIVVRRNQLWLSVYLQLAKEADFQDACAKAVYERLRYPLDSLVICKMPDEIGYGLFTTKNIPVGTVICIYAGEFYPLPLYHNFTYSRLSIDAGKYGGFARFMQHQPISKETHLGYLMQVLRDPRLFAIHENLSLEEAKNLLADQAFLASKTDEYVKEVANNAAWGEYHKKYPDNVAQSNVYQEFTDVAGIQVMCLIAMCDIKANESIGYSYGSMYWRHPSINSSPRLFTKDGDILSRSVLESAIVSSSENSSDNNSTTKPNMQNTTSKITSNENKQEVLQKHTTEFFKHSIDAEGAKYPEKSLVGKYVGHQEQFFTMPLDKAKEAKEFTQQLKNIGFDAELKARL